MTNMPPSSARMKEHILAGDIYQVVASRTFSAPCPDPLSAFARVRAIDRSPYMFFVSMPDCALFGASPETSVRVTREGGKTMVEVKPIAGTRPRGVDGDQDDRMEADLRLDTKESAEHMMLVDLARNDVARVSEPGTRHVASLMTLERYARVMHLVSSVEGRARQALRCAPRAAGLPQSGHPLGSAQAQGDRAAAALRAHPRAGPMAARSAGSTAKGRWTPAIVIRSALVKDGTAYVRAGAGVVHDSDPVAEADETRRKASAVLSAIAGESVR